jgi:predicted Zn-dependent peptidase
VVTVNVWYDVGSRNERASRTGFAHLFEHMMFQGSANVEKGAHFQLIERAGGNLNGSTSADRTNYYQTLPSNRLNLGLWLEADRMRSLAVTEASMMPCTSSRSGLSGSSSASTTEAKPMTAASTLFIS